MTLVRHDASEVFCEGTWQRHNGQRHNRWGWTVRGGRVKRGGGYVLLRFEVSVNYAQTVQMVKGQGQLCKVEFHILLCKHNLVRTGHVYCLDWTKGWERTTAASNSTKHQHSEREKDNIINTQKRKR